MAKLLAAMSLEGRHTLVVLTGLGQGDVVFKSLRNLEGVRVLRSNELNAYSILWADHLVFMQSALDAAAEVFA
jgi:ribosomal protein L4